MAKREMKKVNSDVTQETLDVEDNAGVTEARVELPVGVVSDCSRLNVRTKPNLKAKVLTEIAVKSKVRVDLDASTGEWYKVITDGCVQGYCMKKYITLN